jgi:hypothetical protein
MFATLLPAQLRFPLKAPGLFTGSGTGYAPIGLAGFRERLRRTSSAGDHRYGVGGDTLCNSHGNIQENKPVKHFFSVRVEKIVLIAYFAKIQLILMSAIGCPEGPKIEVNFDPFFCLSGTRIGLKT